MSDTYIFKKWRNLLKNSVTSGDFDTYYGTWTDTTTDKSGWNEPYTFEGGQYLPESWKKYYPTEQGDTYIPGFHPFNPNPETENISKRIRDLEKELKENKENLDKLRRECDKLIKRNKKIEKENKELKERNEKLNKYNKFEIMDI